MTDITGSLDASDLKVGVVVAEFNAAVTDGLLAGALATLEEAGAVDPTVVRVAGAFELPVVARALVMAGYECVIALGAVIRGETDHYQHIATQAAAGLRQVALETGVVVSFGVLTVTEASHAFERSRPGPDNKGAEATRAAIRAADAIRLIAGSD